MKNVFSACARKDENCEMKRKECQVYIKKMFIIWKKKNMCINEDYCTIYYYDDDDGTEKG